MDKTGFVLDAESMRQYTVTKVVRKYGKLFDIIEREAIHGKLEVSAKKGDELFNLITKDEFLDSDLKTVLNYLGYQTRYDYVNGTEPQKIFVKWF